MNVRLLTAGAAALSAIASTGASAQAPDGFCAELRRIVAAADEQPPFSSMRWEPHAALGFDDCSILDLSLKGDSPSFGCFADTPDAPRRWEQLNTDIQRCLPEAAPFDPRRGSRHVPPVQRAFFRLGEVLIVTIEQEIGFEKESRRSFGINIEPYRG